MFQETDVFGRSPAMPDDSKLLPAAAGASPDGIGESPDGIGAYARQDGGPPMRNMQQPPPGAANPGGMMLSGPPMDGTWDFYEPDDVSSDAAVRSAGLTALFATVMLGTGVAIGGPWGAGAGLLLAGSAVNGYRAQKWWGSAEPSEKHEAVVSAVFATFGIAVGGYMAYKAFQDKKD